jgi:hypothetical protein
VGYWVRDREGSFRSDHFLTRLPSSTSASGARVIVWAWKKTKVQIYDRTSRAKLFSGTLAADGYHEIGFQELQKLGSHVLEITAADEAASVQIYYDEGFFVPGSDGRAAGKRFQTFVGDITNGVNDLSLFAYKQSARAVVTDIKTGVPIWGGEIEPGGIHTIALTNRYVRVTSDEEISVAVAPYKHRNITGYAEHHFAAGQEGTGIENTFLLTTPRELWIFSYYDRNAVEVTDGRTGRSVWKGTLSAGQVAGIHPGQGYYRVRSTKGSSAMGGAAACGAEYSPAGGMFEVDEALLKVIMQIKEQRRQRAAAEGRRITNDELNAPLSAPELQQATQSVRRSTKQKRFSPAETRERLKKMQTY